MSSQTPPSAGKALFVVVVTTLVALAFTASYAGALHKPAPHSIPVAAVSPGVPNALIRHVDSSSAFKVRRVASPAAAYKSIDERAAYGALVPIHGGLRLVIAPAASVPISTIISGQLGGSLRAVGVPVTVSAVHPLASGDSSGVMVFYAVAGWVIAGYFGALMLGGTFGPLPPRRQMAMRMVTLSVLAVVAGVACAGLAFAIGDLPGSLVAASALGIFTVLSVGVVATGLQALFGPLVVIVLIIVLIVIGYPASGGPLAIELLPGFWRAIGQLIPVGASVTALRNIVYFPDASLGGPLLTLGVWLIVGASVALVRAGRNIAPQTITHREAETAGAAAAAP